TVFSSQEEVFDIPRLTKIPKVDGVLDNPIWQREALRITTFHQLSPKEMADPSEKTVAYIGYDERNLYIAFRCYDSEPEKIRASLTNRDSCIEDDWILVFLDTFNEKRRAFGFLLNPLGIQMDCLRIEEGGNENMDFTWDTVFKSEGKIDAHGYVVEMAVPFKSIRFPDTDDKVWGLTLGRNIPGKGELLLWPDFTREISGLITQSGEIRIRGDVEKGKNFEIMPVVTSLKTKNSKIDPEAGLNLKWGVSSDLTLDVTVNPDYSHIEADAPQIEANQRFALFYTEKRPFFLEGMEIFRFPEVNLVYTRRIIDPAAGGKATGKVGRFTYGFLTAYDLNPTESLWDVSENGEARDEKALFNIFRIKADVAPGSYLGFCLTDKKIDGSFNRVAGVDGQFKWKDNFFFSFQAIGSKTKFEERETNIVPALTAEASYFSKYWGAGVAWQSMHPDFEASAGFVNRVDFRRIVGYSFLNFYPEKNFMNQIRLSMNAGQMYEYIGNTLSDRWVTGNVHLRFTEFNQMNITYKNSMERYEGIDFYKNNLNLDCEFSLIGWLPFGAYFQTGNSIYYDPDEPYLGYSNTYGIYMTFKPSKRLQYSLDFTKQTFWKKRGGEQVYDINIVRSRLTYQISRALSLRGICDYDHCDKTVYGSFLVSWVLKPGTLFFFGVDQNLMRNDLGNFTQNDYSVFVKFSYWWRI
ncbi:MAG: DUF5916 domain-containing protein, partial [Candidatus Aminicenantes bacterium]